MKRFMLASTNPVNFQQHLRSLKKTSGFLLVIISRLHNYKRLNKVLLLVPAIACFQLEGLCQNATEKQASFRKVLTERSAKIVNTLSLDQDKYQQVLTMLVNQYLALNVIHDESKMAIDGIKNSGVSKEEAEGLIKKQEAEKATKLAKLHSFFISGLKVNLTDAQIEQVKDGMTYRVLPITWKAYQDMLPNLSIEQKEKMYGWLVEARELAMDEGSSDRKHAVFGKYKGRINNYLSAAGYDMKKEGIEWQKRIKEREAAQKSTNNQ